MNGPSYRVAIGFGTSNTAATVDLGAGRRLGSAKRRHEDPAFPQDFGAPHTLHRGTGESTEATTGRPIEGRSRLAGVRSRVRQ